MTILQQPDVHSLSGNIAPFRINSASPVLFTLRQGSEEILSHRYAPGQDGYITIDIRDIVQFTKDAHLAKFTDTGQKKKTKIFSLRFQRTEKVAHDATYFSLQLLIVVAIQHRRIIFVYK